MGAIIYKASAVVNGIFEEKFALLRYVPKRSQENSDTKNDAKKITKIYNVEQRKSPKPQVIIWAGSQAV